MPLDKKIFPVSFAQGVNTKTDPKQVVAGKFLLLENTVFTKDLQFTKRNGYDKLPSAGDTGSALVSYNNELLAFDGLNVKSYAQSLNSFTSKGQAVSVEVGSQQVVSNGYQQTSMDGTFHSYGLKVFAWEDTRNGIRYAVVDNATGQVLVADTVLDSSATAVRPKVFALGNYVLITYFDGTNLVYKSFSVANPSTLSSKTDLATNVNGANPTYDATTIGQRVFFTYNTSTGGGSVAVNYIDSTLNLATAYEQAGEAATTCIAVWGDSFENAWIGYYNGTKVKTFVVSYSLVSVVAATDVATVASVRNLTGVMTAETSSTASVAKLLYERSATQTYDYFVTSAALTRSTSTITPGTPAVLIRSVGLASKCFTWNDTQYVGVTYQSTTQPTYFILTVTGLIVAKVAPGVGGGLTAKSILPEVSNISDSEVLVAWGKKNQLEVQSGNVFSTIGVIGASLSFLSTNTYLRATAANNLHIKGGFLSMYDGVSVVEHGFHLFPEQASVVGATTTGAIQAGTFQYCIVYEWADNQGQVHRSAPSTAQTVVVPAGTSKTFTADTTSGSVTLTAVSSLTNLFVGQLVTGTGIPANTYITAFPSGSTITMSNAATATNTGTTIATIYTNKNTLTIPTLRVTAKQSTRAPVVIGVYRTQASGTVFYRVSSISSPTFNSTTTDTVSFVDTTADLYLTGNELLYTTGGVLENIAAPACSFISNYKDKLVIVPSENKNSYWISKEVSPGIPVQFTDFFEKAVNPFGGPLTGVFQEDEKALLFKKNCIMLTAGDGPNDTGQQDDLAKPYLVTTDVGCINSRSLVIMPKGIMFQSGKGIYLLDRSLNAIYIGAPVEAYNSLTITSAQLIPNTNQVRFTTAEGTCLVYDYYVDQWSVFTNHYAVDSTIFENLFTYLDPDGFAWQETIGEYLDGSAFIRIRLLTSWLQFAGLQGFQRVYQALLLGDYKSLHKIIVTIAYDFDSNPTQQAYIDAGALLQPSTYGTSSPYGSDTVYGGDFPLYQFRVDMAKQQCQAIQIGIEEVQTSDFGEGLSLSGATFLAGVKRGLYKIPASRQVG